MHSLARSVPKPLKVPSLARSVLVKKFLFQQFTFDFHFTSYLERWRGRRLEEVGGGAEAGFRVKAAERRGGRAGERMLEERERRGGKNHFQHFLPLV